jgi:hypothetical protein
VGSEREGEWLSSEPAAAKETIIQTKEHCSRDFLPTVCLLISLLYTKVLVRIPKDKQWKEETLTRLNLVSKAPHRSCPLLIQGGLMRVI